jgi:hypothetical protein
MMSEERTIGERLNALHELSISALQHELARVRRVSKSRLERLKKCKVQLKSSEAMVKQLVAEAHGGHSVDERNA